MACSAWSLKCVGALMAAAKWSVGHTAVDASLSVSCLLNAFERAVAAAL